MDAIFFFSVATFIEFITKEILKLKSLFRFVSKVTPKSFGTSTDVPL